MEPVHRLDTQKTLHTRRTKPNLITMWRIFHCIFEYVRSALCTCVLWGYLICLSVSLEFSMRYCCMRDCTNNDSYANISFHTFPKDEKYRSLWIDSVNRGENWKPKPRTVVCSL